MLAPSVVVCSPEWIASNPETAATNAYQQVGKDTDREVALAQYADLVGQLRQAGISVLELDGPEDAPDAVFPNNWFSTHADGTLALYPMLASSRRRERNLPGLQGLLEQSGHRVSNVVDFSPFEDEEEFVEGTGSLVFDHENRIAYACLSGRTTEPAVITVCGKLNYDPVMFRANDLGMAIYHTNVVFALGSDFAVVCLEAIENAGDLRLSLAKSGKDVIEITREQMRAFCGNVLELAGPVMLMSNTAYHSFTPAQLDRLGEGRTILHPDISAIERLGGGSARCMVGEIFLPRI